MSLIKASSPTGKKLRHGLRLVGGSLILAAFALWVKTGAHPGFTKNRVEISRLDPITQIEYTDYEERLVLGVEYLAAASVVGLGLIASGFFLCT